MSSREIADRIQRRYGYTNVRATRALQDWMKTL